MRAMTEHRLQAHRLAHRVRKLPLLDVAIEVKALRHDRRHLQHLGAVHPVQHDLPDIRYSPRTCTPGRRGRL